MAGTPTPVTWCVHLSRKRDVLPAPPAKDKGYRQMSNGSGNGKRSGRELPSVLLQSLVVRRTISRA